MLQRRLRHVKTITLKNLQCKSFKGKDITKLQVYFTVHSDDKLKGKHYGDIKYSHVYNTTLKFHLSYLILSSNVIYIQLFNFQHTFSTTIVALDCLLGCVSNFFLIFLLEFYKSEEIHGSLVSKLFISSARCT